MAIRREHVELAKDSSYHVALIIGNHHPGKGRRGKSLVEHEMSVRGIEYLPETERQSDELPRPCAYCERSSTLAPPAASDAPP